ncbi:N-glycosylase/DNA lyase isoform 2-T6 [Salvelinus alpinus]|uniref:N-glycosylase/DNA lyase isoform X2 n=1 Tax=Salvelinus alpinus TaxID=8036 RepID=UPI0039FC9973
MSQHALLSAGTKSWRSLACSRSELRLDLTLGCGQSFRWRETGDGHWTGVMGGRVWTLTQTDDTLWYHTYNNPNTIGGDGRKRSAGSLLQGSKGSGKRSKGVIEVKEEEEGEPVAVTPDPDRKEEELLNDYFQLKVKLGDLYRDWGAADPHFNSIAKIFTDNSVEACLRDLGFGYRARFLQQSARQILDSHGGPHWLQGLRSVPYLQARDALRTLPGVGPKVADCVCLMSLEKACVVPVDTHVWQIAKRDYSCAVGNGQKSLTDKVHRQIGDFFKQLWGPYAGWAHSVLFCSDLKKFQKLKETHSLKQEEEKVKIKVEGEGINKNIQKMCNRKVKMSVKEEVE